MLCLLCIVWRQVHRPHLSACCFGSLCLEHLQRTLRSYRLSAMKLIRTLVHCPYRSTSHLKKCYCLKLRMRKACHPFFFALTKWSPAHLPMASLFSLCMLHVLALSLICRCCQLRILSSLCSGSFFLSNFSSCVAFFRMFYISQCLLAMVNALLAPGTLAALECLLFWGASGQRICNESK